MNSEMIGWPAALMCAVVAVAVAWVLVTLIRKMPD
jgi:hypothetical protein